MYGIKKLALVLPFFLVLSFIPSSVFALAGTWAGYVSNETAVFNSSYLTPNNLPVEIFRNGASSPTYNISLGYGGFAGYYIVDVDESGTNDITFKVCGVNVTQGIQTFTTGPHPTGASPYYNLTWNRSANSAACTYACGCSGGYCNSGSCASSAPTTTTLSSGGGGGGGGGSSATTTTTTTTTATSSTASTATTTTTTTTTMITQNVGNVQANTPTEVSLPSSESTAIASITLQTNEAANDVQLTVQTTSAPSTASVAISSSSGSVYRYLDVKAVNVESSAITSAKFKFKVERTWFDANQIDQTTVNLNRLVDNNWVKLATSITGGDDNYVFYEATSPGFSVFAITGQKIAIGATTTTVPLPTTTTIAVTTTTEAAAPAATFEINVVVVFVIIMLIIAAVYFYKRKNRSLGLRI